LERNDHTITVSKLFANPTTSDNRRWRCAHFGRACQFCTALVQVTLV